MMNDEMMQVMKMSLQISRVTKSSSNLKTTKGSNGMSRNGARLPMPTAEMIASGRMNGMNGISRNGKSMNGVKTVGNMMDSDIRR